MNGAHHLFAYVLTAAMACAQDPPQLRQTGRTAAIGGEVVNCFFVCDGKQMVTVGEAGDLVWWDLATLRPRWRVPPIDACVTALAQHPTAPWAVVAVSKGGFEGGSVHVLNLATREVQPLWSRGATALAFDDDGTRLAVLFHESIATPLQVFATSASPLTAGALPLHDWPTPGTFVRTMKFAPDGRSLSCSDGLPFLSSHWQLQVALADGTRTEHLGATATPPAETAALPVTLGDDPHLAVAADGHSVARLRGNDGPNVVDRLAPTPASWDCTSHVESWLERLWVAPGGAIAAADVQGQLHVLGPEAERHRLASGNQGVATGLTWSPDSRFLAVQGMGALRVVDRSGRVMFELPGSHAVAPGTAGAEFVTADRVGMQRWNAAVAHTIGDDVAWRGGRPRMLTSHRREPDSRAVFGDYEDAYTLYGSAPMVPLPTGALFGAGKIGGTPAPPMLADMDGALTAVRSAQIRGAYYKIETGAGRWDASRNRALMTGFTPPYWDGTGRVGSTLFGTLRAFDAEGTEILARGFESGVCWIAPFHHDARLLVGLDGGEVHELDAESFAPLAKWKLEAWTRWFFPLDDKLAIAGDGTRVLLFSMPTDDAGPQLLHAVSPPPGLGPVHLAALAPDHHHLALASASDVRIVVIE